MEDEMPADVPALHRQNLEAFVVRARRVEEHSLAADWNALVALTAVHVKIVHIGGDKVRIRHQLPPEEVVESAAARIRPILLVGDRCFYQKALKALGYFCRTLPNDTAWIRSMRAEWRSRVAPSTVEEAGYWVAVSNTLTGEDRSLDRHKLVP